MHHEMRRAALALTMLLGLPLTLAAQGGGGGGASDTGDVFGDLLHIKRSAITGQPILQKRWIELPGDLFGWGYCPIPVDANGLEIPFADLSCDVDPSLLASVVEVDYFGRLSGARTREINIRMHFDEAIVNIKQADIIELEPAGRIRMGTDCTPDGICSSWKIIDSPLENMAFYHRILKYGHIQTDPLEEDVDFSGDPALGTVYHPALGPEDWTKFTGVLAALLPRASPDECFTGDVFNAACAAPQALTSMDFIRAASFLGGAADKHGKMSVDLVQYLNRILKITTATEYSVATLNTLPALIRSCEPEVLVCTDEVGVIEPAEAGLPWPANELFVNFSPASYLRDDHFTMTYAGLKKGPTPGTWVEDPALSVFDFLVFINGPSVAAIDIDAFVRNSSDAQRAVEFVHGYETPSDLFATATTTTVTPALAPFSLTDRTVTLTATITNGIPVEGGIVIFVVETSAGEEVGLTVASGPVVSGAAAASYLIPGGTAEQVLIVRANYSGAEGFAASSGTGTLTITPPDPPQISVADASVTEGTGTGSSLAFELTLSWPSASTVTVQYATTNHTAVAPADYEATAGTATFDPGVVSVAVMVPVVGDSLDEPDETLSFVLSAPVSGTLSRAAATGMIVDDDGGAVPAVLDFNQDGWADLAWRHAVDGRIGVWYMQGLTQILARVTEPSAEPDLLAQIRAVGDFNGDWKPDLIFQHAGTGALSAWFMDGYTHIGTGVLTTLAGGSNEPVLDWKVVGAADMDRNGQLDLVWQHETTGALRIWHMTGTAQIDSTPISLGVGPASDWHVVGVADMNGDGWSDLIWRNLATGGVAAWLMEDAQVITTAWVSPASVPDPLWRVVGARDMNRDGHADLLWQHFGDGRIAVWLMNGLTATGFPYFVPSAVTDVNWQIVGAR